MCLTSTNIGSSSSLHSTNRRRRKEYTISASLVPFILHLQSHLWCLSFSKQEKTIVLLSYWNETRQDTRPQRTRHQSNDPFGPTPTIVHLVLVLLLLLNCSCPLCVCAYQMESSQRCCPFCFSYFDIEKDLRFSESSETCRNWSRFYKHSIERQWCPACGVLGWQWQRDSLSGARQLRERHPSAWNETCEKKAIAKMGQKETFHCNKSAILERIKETAADLPVCLVQKLQQVLKKTCTGEQVLRYCCCCYYIQVLLG